MSDEKKKKKKQQQEIWGFGAKLVKSENWWEENTHARTHAQIYFQAGQLSLIFLSIWIHVMPDVMFVTALKWHHWPAAGET